MSSLDWARDCPVCGAAPNQKCATRGGLKLWRNHPEHELLGWEIKYDMKYRELKPREQFGQKFPSRFRKIA